MSLFLVLFSDFVYRSGRLWVCSLCGAEFGLYRKWFRHFVREHLV